MGACAPDDRSAGKSDSDTRVRSTSIAPSPSELFGRWRIVAVNHGPPQTLKGSRGLKPYISFSPEGYGGNTGCNTFGGLGLIEGGRYYAVPPVQTVMGCGTLSDQEAAITGLLLKAPQISKLAATQISLKSGDHEIILAREAVQPQARASPPRLLAGTEWQISGVDGKLLVHRADGRRRSLRFDADRWTVTLDCLRFGGGWRQSGNRIAEVGTPSAPATSPCVSDPELRTYRAIRALMSAGPRFVTGPNGEILMGGDGHWITGGSTQSAVRDGAGTLAGSWTVTTIDGQPPVAGRPRPAIAFGADGFTGSTGCNSMQGSFLAHAGRLFTTPPIATEQGCAEPLRSQEARMLGLIAAGPRIAFAARGGLVLVDRRGELRFQRSIVSVEPRLLAASDLDGRRVIELTSFDGRPLALSYADPASRFEITGDRWQAVIRGRALSGTWRRRSGELQLFTDALLGGRQEPAVDAAVMQLLNGPARVLMTNDTFILADEEHWLIGRPVVDKAGPNP